MVALLEETKTIKRGEVYLCDLGEQPGHRMRGIRPCLIISNDISNHYAPIIQAIPITSKIKKLLPVHVRLEAAESNLERDSTIMCEQSTVLNKSDLTHLITKLSPEILARVEKAILIHNGINVNP